MTDKYSTTLRAIHWIMAVLIITLLAIGIWMSGLPDSYPGKFDYYALHKSFGIIALIFVTIRLAVRFQSNIPALPIKIRPFDNKLSQITIFLLYAAMIIMPFSGYLMSDLGGYQISFFSIKLPFIFEKHEALATFFYKTHGIVGNFLIFIITLHLLGTLKHFIFEKINLLKRII
jgi:cytochrome b561